MGDLHKLIDSGNWDQINWDLVNIEGITKKNRDGETPLHIAANKGFLGKIPRKFLTKETLSIEEDGGYSVFACACYKKCLKDIPKDILSVDILLLKSSRDEPLLCKIIDCDQIQEVPTHLFETGILLTHCDAIDTTFLHSLAAAGRLKNIPEKFYKGYIGLRDENGENLLHATAEKGRLNDFPITEEIRGLVSQENKYGETPLHRVLKLNESPREFLTKENLERENWRGETPIHKSTNVYGINYLPLENLEEKLLNRADYKGNTPMGDIIEEYKKQRDRKKLRELLKKLSTEFLKATLEKFSKSEAAKEIRLELTGRKILEKTGQTNVLNI